MKKKPLFVASVLLSSLLFSGCTTTITNLTPSTQKRTAEGLYPFEVAFDSRNGCIRRDSLQPFVQVGPQIYPMQPTLGLKDRWETLIPVTADKDYVNYRFKFVYKTRTIPEPTPNSKLSAPFQLQILDK